MFARLLLLFTLVPVLELALLIYIGQHIGVLPTVGLILVTGLLGAWLAHREGARTWHKVRSSLAHGQMPGDALLHGMAIFGGGALLLTPGVLTDVLGFALLIPASRGGIVRQIRRRLERRLMRSRGGIDVRFWTHDSRQP